MADSKTRDIVSGCGALMVTICIAAALLHFNDWMKEHSQAVTVAMYTSGLAAIVCFLFWYFSSESANGTPRSSNSAGRDNLGSQVNAREVAIHQGDNYYVAPPTPAHSPVAPPPAQKQLPVLELTFSQGRVEISEEIVRFAESGRPCYLISVRNRPAALDGGVAFCADSISVRIAFDHAGKDTAGVERACWIGKVENQISLRPGDTGHVLFGIVDQEWWTTYGNPNKYATEWPSQNEELREIRFPMLLFPIPGDITIIANQVNKATTLAVKKFVIIASDDIRWQDETRVP